MPTMRIQFICVFSAAFIVILLFSIQESKVSSEVESALPKQNLSVHSDDKAPSVDWGEDKESLLVYYAVPKCGSTSFTNAMKVLSQRNGFNFMKEEKDWRGFQTRDWSVQKQVGIFANSST